MDSVTSPTPPWRIGVDVGGTFTDMVLRDSAGSVRIFKAPSVPADPSEGVLGVLRLAAQRLDLPLTELLRSCALFVHGSTVATNTILEKKGARVGMLTTEGFRDSLEIRRGIRENQWDHRAPFPEVLVPRYLRLPVRGRISSDGSEAAPLEAADVGAAASTFAAEGVESVAVCLFNSFLDGAHERAAGAELERNGMGQWVSLSSEVMPTMGEYERGSTAVVNAYIAPKVTGYLQALDRQLRQLGLPNSLLLLQSNGGAVSVDQVAARPVMLVLSGPAAGVGALKGCAGPGEAANFISMEIGGTSCDVMVMAKGEVPIADSLVIDGYHLTTPSVEIHTVGAGGGTIAWVDSAGLLHVGPQGAGARPGPAAYGLGGEQPTVTDAQLVLGRLQPGPLAGGAVTLDGTLARKAIETKLAKPLGLSVEEAAAGVIRLLEQNLLHAVERLSSERGHNPSTFTLVAAGGAGPMHGASVARALGCRRALLPRAAGAFCAMGMLQSDVRQDYLKVFIADLDTVEPDAVGAAFAELETRAADARLKEREFDLRYEGQQWPVRVALGPLDTTLDKADVRARFESEHQRLYGHIQPHGRIDITALRVIGRTPLDWTPPAAQSPQQSPPLPRETRRVWVDATHGWQDVPVYGGEALRPGCKLAGPLLIEERTTTAFVGPRDLLEIDSRDDFLVHVNAALPPHSDGEES
ncbi:MAG: hydantoinase/oxoprolinase family protein [Proteobacteria bacterium]|nr:hydantoinase/oxoprolinase family protein [Pseudomonadota bacterium]